MKIAIIHHDLEFTENKFKQMFEDRGCYVDFLDIRKINRENEEQLKNYDIILNRVYSSVASRDFNSLLKTLALLKRLEENNIKCINCLGASLTDYSKYELYKVLSTYGIPTPSTIFVSSKKYIKNSREKAIKNFGFPIVIKRNCGGKSYDVTRVYSLNELTYKLKNSFKLAEEQGYKGGFLLQKYIESVREHDCRVAVIEGKFAFSYARSFISRNSKDKWMASTSGGSSEFDYKALSEEKEIAIKANLAIGASLSESDVIMTKTGPYIIEVNLTPGYFVDNTKDLNRMKLIVDNIISHNKKIIKIEVKK